MNFLNLPIEVPDEFAIAFFKARESYGKVKIVVCQTPAEAESVLRCFDRCGFRWKSGTPYSESPLGLTTVKRPLAQFLRDQFFYFTNICFTNDGTWGPLSAFPLFRDAKDRCVKVSDINADLISKMLGGVEK